MLEKAWRKRNPSTWEDLIEYYSAIKKNETMPFAATWIDLETTILSEVSQKEKDKYHMMSLMCGMQNMLSMNLSMKQKQTNRHRRSTCACQGVEEGEGLTGSLGFVDANYKWVNNKALLFSTGNYIQYPVINCNRK